MNRIPSSPSPSLSSLSSSLLSSSRRRVLASAVALTGIFAFSNVAFAADPLAPPAPPAPPPAAATSAKDPAAAQALFYEARNLMKDGKYALACPKLEESLRMDYGIGTEFNLADCNEKQGKLATAWSGFLSVAAASKTQNQPQREKVARERAKAIEPRLPKLSIEVVATATPGLEVKRDGVVIGSASWGTAVPVDSGAHRITASAPGRQTWEGTVSATEGKVAKITVPQLGAAADNAPVAAAAVVAPPATAQEPQQVARTEPAAFPEPVVERGSTQRTVGWLVSAAGLASLGVGAGFGIDSLKKRDGAKDHCDGNVCDPTGISLRSKAMRSGDVATYTTIAGGAALVGGLVLVFTAPRGSHKEAPPTTGARSIRAVPNVALNGDGGGVLLQGVLP